MAVAHASELALLFGPIPAAAQIETDFANTFLDFYINFVNDLIPDVCSFSGCCLILS
jgi:hypothetical protein